MKDIKVDTEPLEATEPEHEPAHKSNFKPQYTFTVDTLRAYYDNYIDGKAHRKADIDMFIAAALLSILERMDK